MGLVGRTLEDYRVYKLNKYGPYSEIYDKEPHHKQNFVEKVLHIKKPMSPGEQRAYEDELLEREKLILGEKWSEQHNWSWYMMYRYDDVPKRAKDAGVKPFDWFEVQTLRRVKRVRGLGKCKEDKKNRDLEGRDYEGTNFAERYVTDTQMYEQIWADLLKERDYSEIFAQESLMDGALEGRDSNDDDEATLCDKSDYKGKDFAGRDSDRKRASKEDILRDD
ncbi:MAG: hypothetical protein Q9223_000694 [Gallowayella weberi]